MTKFGGLHIQVFVNQCVKFHDDWFSIDASVTPQSDAPMNICDFKMLKNIRCADDSRLHCVVAATHMLLFRVGYVVVYRNQ